MCGWVSCAAAHAALAEQAQHFVLGADGAFEQRALGICLHAPG